MFMRKLKFIMCIFCYVFNCNVQCAAAFRLCYVMFLVVYVSQYIYECIIF